MREVSHLGSAGLPPRMLPQVDEAAVMDLAWARRERADANVRRAVGELRALAVEDGLWARQYLAMADAFESALQLLDAIEDAS